MGVTEPISQILEVFYQAVIQWCTPAFKELSQQPTNSNKKIVFQLRKTQFTLDLATLDSTGQDSLSLAV